MTDDEIRALYDAERQTLRTDGEIEREGGIVRQMPTGNSQYWITFSRHTSSDIDDAIEREKAHLAALKPRYTQFEWKVYSHDQPPDLRDRLAAHGFDIDETEAFMVLDTADAPPQFLAPLTLDVRRVTELKGVADYFAIGEAVFQHDYSAWKDEVTRLVVMGDPSVSMFVAYDGDTPVSACRISYAPGSQFAGLWGGATLLAYRGQGYYSATVAARLQEAKARGVRFLFIDALPMSRAILEKRGFRLLSHTWPCVWRG